MTDAGDLESLKPDLPFRWVPWSIQEVAEPFYKSHPKRAGSVRAALELIAADPYALQVREYMGHDEPGKLYEYAINEYLSIVFGAIADKSWLILRAILDYRDLSES